jgi:hypothetical protein
MKKKKPGPRPMAKEQRLKGYNVVLSAADYEHCLTQAIAEGVSTSKFIRDLINKDMKRKTK